MIELNFAKEFSVQKVSILRDESALSHDITTYL